MPKGKRRKPDSRFAGENGWNHRNEGTVKSLQHKCQVYSWMHMTSATKKQSRDRKSQIGFIFLSIAAGSISFANVPYLLAVLAVAAGVLGYVESVAQGLMGYLDYAESSNQHKEASSRYDQVAQLIQRQLDSSQSEREEARSFVSWIQREFNSIHNAAPLLSPSLLTKFEKQYNSKLNPDFMNKDVLNEQPLGEDVVVDLGDSDTDPETGTTEDVSVFKDTDAQRQFEDAQARYEMDRWFS